MYPELSISSFFPLSFPPGTVGDSLSELESKLFISRDGGMTWRLAHEGDFHINVLDQGGAIVAVNISASNDMSKSIL